MIRHDDPLMRWVEGEVARRMTHGRHVLDETELSRGPVDSEHGQRIEPTVEAENELAVGMHQDLGAVARPLRKQNVIYAEAGYHIDAVKLMPFVSYSNRNVDGTNTGDESRTLVGVGYMAQGNNLNLKASYGKIDRKGGESSNVFAVQIQGFFF
jgi:hypothetical protein